VVSKCGRFAETGLKLYAQCLKSPRNQLEDGLKLSEDDLQRLFCVFMGQISYLRGEYASLVVTSSFDSETARYFRQFENNQATFERRSLQNIRIAADLSNITSRSSSIRVGIFPGEPAVHDKEKGDRKLPQLRRRPNRSSGFPASSLSPAQAESLVVRVTHRAMIPSVVISLNVM
jgi:hypothetical protein